MREVFVCSINQQQHKGVTEPYVATLCYGEETFLAFIKTKDNPQGDRCLINELISYRLAKELDILMPVSGVAIINNETQDNTGSFELLNNTGSCFFSKQIYKANNLSKSTMYYIDNKDCYEKIMLFDHLIYNSDRNPGNIILPFKKGKKLLYTIDHTHVFKNQCIWDANSLRLGIKENDYLDTRIVEDNSSVYDLFLSDKHITKNSLFVVADEFLKKCSKKVVEYVLKDLPKDWLISQEELIALRDYILYRASHLKDMCQVIAKQKGLENE